MRRHNYIAIGFVLGVALAILDCFADAFVFHGGSLADQFLRPTPAETWMRSMLIVACLALGAHFQRMAGKRDELEAALKRSYDKLEQRAHERTLALSESNLRLEEEVDERQRAEVQLRLMQFAIDHGSDPIYWVKADGGIAYANQAACQALGYGAEELRSISVSDFDLDFPREAWPGHWNEMKEVGTATFEAHHRTKQGRVFPVEITTNYLKHEGQEYIWAYARDITERKRAERALRESEERFRRVVTNINDALIVDNEEGRIVYANDRFLDMFGFARQDMPSLGLDDYVAPQWYERLCGYHDRRVRGEEAPERFEYEGKRKDGSSLWLEVCVTQIMSSSRIVGTQSLIRDITQRKRAEEALQRSETLYRTILEAAPQMIWQAEADGACSYLNQAWEDIIGMPKEEALGSGWATVIHPDDAPGFLAKWERAYAHGESYSGECRLQSKDGSYRTFDFVGTPVRDLSGEIIHWVGINTDITERKRAEEALREAHEELEQRVEQRTAELESANHRLRAEVEERRQAEEALRQSEARVRRQVEEWQRTFDAVEDAILVVDENGKIFQANRAASDLCPETEGPLIGRYCYEVIHGSDEPSENCPHCESRRCGASREGEIFEPHRRQWLRISSFPLLSSNEQVCPCVLVIADVTERKRTEEALRESEERFRRAVVDAPMPMMIHAEDGEVLRVNRVWTDLTGYLPEEIPTIADWTERAYGERQEAVRERIDKLYRIDGRVAEGDYTITANDGRTIIWDFSSSPLGRLADGRRLILSIATDVTERRRVEQALRESEARTQAVLNAALNVIITIDDQGTVQSFNSSAERTFGYAAEEIIGQNVKVIMPSPDREKHDGYLTNYLNSGKKRILCNAREVVGRRKDGTAFPLELSVTEARVGDWRVFVGILEDLTERKLAAEQIRKHQEELAHLSRLSTMGEMATSLAHELNQPLASIVNYTSGCVQRIQAGRPDLQGLVAVLNEASSEAQRAGEIIKRTRRFVQKREPARTTIDIPELIRQVLHIMRYDLQNQGIQTRLEVEEHMPTLQGDQIQLQQVLLNLLRNGIEAMSGTAAKHRRLTVGATADNGHSVTLFVRDTGCGLGEADPDRIFEPFYTTKEDGTGMGLAISRTIIEAHGGRLWATGNADVGCTFRFSLPQHSEA